MMLQKLDKMKTFVSLPSLYTQTPMYIGSYQEIMIRFRFRNKQCDFFPSLKTDSFT